MLYKETFVHIQQNDNDHDQFEIQMLLCKSPGEGIKFTSRPEFQSSYIGPSTLSFIEIYGLMRDVILAYSIAQYDQLIPIPVTLPPLCDITFDKEGNIEPIPPDNTEYVMFSWGVKLVDDVLYLPLPFNRNMTEMFLKGSRFIAADLPHGTRVFAMSPEYRRFRTGTNGTHGLCFDLSADERRRRRIARNGCIVIDDTTHAIVQIVHGNCNEAVSLAGCLLRNPNHRIAWVPYMFNPPNTRYMFADKCNGKVDMFVDGYWYGTIDLLHKKKSVGDRFWVLFESINPNPK